MSIAEKVKSVLARNLSDLNKNEEFVKLRNFHEEMRQEGVAQKKPYSLPRLDTIGRRLRQVTTSKTSR